MILTNNRPNEPKEKDNNLENVSIFFYFLSVLRIQITIIIINYNLIINYKYFIRFLVLHNQVLFSCFLFYVLNV